MSTIHDDHSDRPSRRVFHPGRIAPVTPTRERAVPAPAATGEDAGTGRARVGATSAVSKSLGTTTVITDYKPLKQPQPVDFKEDFVSPHAKLRDAARSIVNESTGEISFFDRDVNKQSQHSELFDLDVARMRNWLMLRQAQDILSKGSGAFEMRKKTDTVDYCPYDPDFVGPRHWSTKPSKLKVPRIVADTGEVVTRNEPVFRTVLCMCRVVPKSEASVWQAPAGEDGIGRASWHNLSVCGSPWACPICSERINLARRDQIVQVYDALLLANRPVASSSTAMLDLSLRTEASDAVTVVYEPGHAYMLTFTVRHGLHNSCTDLVEKFKIAQQHFAKSQSFKAATRKTPLLRVRTSSLPFLGYIGRIVALEVTHGNKNGWHPHEHHLWFFDRDVGLEVMSSVRGLLADAWAVACKAAGLPPPSKTFGLDLRKAMSAEEYLTKFADRVRLWGPEKEIASSHLKTGDANVGKGRSPMQILADSMLCAATHPGAERTNSDGRLFREFAHAFLGRHQIQFSRSLKAWLKLRGVDLSVIDESDEALAAKMGADSQFVFGVSSQDFSAIARNKVQCKVLSIVEHEGAEAALLYIESLPYRDSKDKIVARPMPVKSVEFVAPVTGGVHIFDSAWTAEAARITADLVLADLENAPVVTPELTEFLANGKRLRFDDSWLTGEALNDWLAAADPDSLANALAISSDVDFRSRLVRL